MICVFIPKGCKHSREREGQLPDKDAEVAKAFGDEIRRRCDNPLAATAGRGNKYRLRFVPGSGTVTGLGWTVLTLRGVSEPNLLKHAPGTRDELILVITAVGETVHLSGTVQGSVSGEITLQKL